MTIEYTNKKTDIQGLHIQGFFEGWPKTPSEEVLVRSIENASFVTLAINKDSDELVGYITALSDNVLSAYIPFLEVIPSYRKQGIGHSLVVKMLEQLDHLYMIDLVCDKEIAGFYVEAGFQPWHAMIKRNYGNQIGAVASASQPHRF